MRNTIGIKYRSGVMAKVEIRNLASSSPLSGDASVFYLLRQIGVKTNILNQF